MEAPPPSRVTPPRVSARTLTGWLRLAKADPIQSESAWLREAGLTWYVPSATTISVTLSSASAA